MWFDQPAIVPRPRSVYNGIDYIVIYKGKVATNWDGTDLKTAPLKLHIAITALVDNDGKTVEMKMAEPSVGG